MYFKLFVCVEEAGGAAAPCFKCKNKDMDYREKHKKAREMQGNQWVDTDKALLKRYMPTSSLMIRTLAMRNGESLSFEILFQLLEYVTPAQIMANRQVQEPAPNIKFHTQIEFSPNKKKGFPNSKSFQKLNGIISQMFSAKKQS